MQMLGVDYCGGAQQFAPHRESRLAGEKKVEQVYVDLNVETQNASNSLSLEILVHDLAQALPNPDATSPRPYASPKSFSTSSSGQESDCGYGSGSPGLNNSILASVKANVANAFSSNDSSGPSQGHQHLHGRSMSWSSYQGMISQQRGTRSASLESNDEGE